MIYLELKDIQQLRGCSLPTASNYYHLLLSICSKEDFQRLTVFDFCKVEQLDLDTISYIIPRFRRLNETIKKESKRI